MANMVSLFFTPIMQKSIRLTGVRHNNLKNVSVEFPARKLSVVTGLSGSGKSSLAFETLYAEGQRRYIESLSTYTRQFLEKMPKPDVDSVENIPPAIALEQRNHVVNSRSTVATQTEIIDFLRVLFAKVGDPYCLECGGKVRKTDAQVILNSALKFFPDKKGAILAPLATEPASIPEQKKTKKKKKKKKASKKIVKKSTQKSPANTRAQPTVLSLLQVLREQGFRRIAWLPARKSKSSEPRVLDLEELDLPEFPKIPDSALSRGELFLIVDRLRFTEADNEVRSRLLDSIEHASRLGRGKLSFLDLDKGTRKDFLTEFACEECGKKHRPPTPQQFSFNSPIGACQTCSGFGHTLELDESLVIPDPSKTLKNGAVDPLSKPSLVDWQVDLFRFAERHGISIGKRYRELTAAQKKLIWEGDPSETGRGRFPGILGCFRQLERWKYKLHIRVFIRRYQSQMLCTSCQGFRLGPSGLSVKIGKHHMGEVLAFSIEHALEWIQKTPLHKTQQALAKDILEQLEKRLGFLQAVGVGYLTLNRLAKTLSGGEFQRINLATQLGNGLCGTLYVLDEPSIGLHAADTERMIGVLESLRDQGNTVVIVEHDTEIMRIADWIVEIGPGAGHRGGEIVAAGPPEEVKKAKDSRTALILQGENLIPIPKARLSPVRKKLKITGCKENNLKNITAEIPLERFVVVTGVSGSGKSTLVHKTLYHALSRVYEGPKGNDGGEFDQLYGAENLAGVVLLDQKPIGKSSRSNPATYLKLWDEFRRIYANQVMSLRRGYSPQHFSFNVDGGRCPTCKGEGEITLDMHFMAEVKLPCEECEGRRFKKNILEVECKGKNVSQLLETTIDEAYDLFRDNHVLVRRLQILRDVGLGYLHLGQSATTLSGGESQRLKIASSLAQKSTQRLLYIFDEPTTGLHQADIGKLVQVVQDLIQQGNSVLMIEHHMDMIAGADWVIDIGPGGGEAGGKIAAQGTPEELAKNPKSKTGEMLQKLGYFQKPTPV